jgi:hypothetical protein
MKKLIFITLLILTLAGCTASYNVSDLPPLMKEEGKTNPTVEQDGFLALRKDLGEEHIFEIVMEREKLYKLVYLGEYWVIYKEL